MLACRCGAGAALKKKPAQLLLISMGLENIYRGRVLVMRPIKSNNKRQVIT